MGHATSTTRQVNRELVEVLEAAHIAGVQAAAAWNRAQRHLAEVMLLSRAHDDLSVDAEVVYSRMADTRALIGMRLKDEREGQS